MNDKQGYGLPHWNYRAVKCFDQGGEVYYAVHEIHYDAEGKPRSMGLDPASFHASSKEELAIMLERAFHDVLEEREFLPPEHWK